MSSFLQQIVKLEGTAWLRSSQTFLAFVQFSFLLSASLSAEPGAKIIIPNSEAWTGQRLPFFVELRAEGTFKGAASFDLPDVPNTVIVKIGSPIISSEAVEQTEYFIQRHEFALFSQASGSLKLPPITARFSHTKGYTGPTFDTSAETTAESLTLNRPPNSSELGFLVTTASLEIEESWDPPPGPLETGAVLKRTIVQRATQLTGIALKPAPTPELEGIRTYPSNPEVTDKTERGDFLGERSEVITYLIQKPGLHTLPEIRYDWWNPATKTLESQALPSVTFSATAPPAPPEKPSPSRFLWLLIPVTLILWAILKRRSLFRIIHRLHEWIDPPPRRMARSFIKACRQNDPDKAARTWENLRRLQPHFHLSKDLEKRILELNTQLYGRQEAQQTWTGADLAAAFQSSNQTRQAPPSQTNLPQLNP